MLRVILFIFGVVIFISIVFAENSCIECHKSISAFSQEQMRFNEIRKEHLEKGISCSLECHEDLLAKLARSNYVQWQKSKHALNNVTCDKCHGGNPNAKSKEEAHVGVLRASNPESPIYYLNVPSTCGKCHKKQYSEFTLSEHYKRLENVKLAPTCSTCHIPHTFTIPEAVELAKICQNCHNENIGANPEVPTKAQRLLKKSLELKALITKMKAEGGENENVRKAEKILDAFPIIWHEFNIERLEAEIDAVSKLLEVEEKKVTPGFGLIIVLSSYLLIFIRRAMR